MQTRFAFGFHLAAGGEISTGLTRDDLERTLGFHARLDFPVHRYVALGPMLSAGAWQSQSGNAAGLKRNFHVDLSLVLRGRYAFELGGGHLDAYAGIPLGGTLFLPHPDNNGKVRGGWHAGWVVGARWFPTEGFGVLVELGWRRHAQRSKFAGTTVETVMRQMTFDIGLVF